MKGKIEKYQLKFLKPGGTSRGVLYEKDTWFIRLLEGDKQGIGECNMFRGLSIDDRPDFELTLQNAVDEVIDGTYSPAVYRNWPSITFGIEQAMLNLQHAQQEIYFPSAFTENQAGIRINGLIWMADKSGMLEQIKQKLDLGFTCLKLKIGTDWPTEHGILQSIRAQFDANQLEIRVDANGAFDFETAEKVLQQLAELKIHSIEQPIKAGQWEQMAALCRSTPCPIALDEELIPLRDLQTRKAALANISPKYIILKPALVGGFKDCDFWINLAEENAVGWWITSALESNVGLSAIAQYTFTKNPTMPQGLGTGQLFHNNTPSGLYLEGEMLYMKPI
ncbi:MAG: o-succinylbenzoate synthase [Weeksellaceae bacterium]|nr:o-succinylbenzoate synthase [Weeksellaceae bacterium]